MKIIEELTKLVETIEAEPLAVGKPAESVQIGRLQVCDEIRHVLCESLSCDIKAERCDIERKIDRMIGLVRTIPLCSALLEQELDVLEEELRDSKITHEEFKKRCRISEENYVKCVDEEK